MRYNLTVGEPITLPANLASLTEPVYIINPRGNIFKVLPSFTRTEVEGSETDSGIPHIIFENTELSGIYTLKMKPAAEKEEKLSSSDIYFALNVDTKESDLTPIDARVLKGLIKSAEFSYFKGTDNVLSTINEHRFGREIWRYLFIFVLTFLVCESILAHQIDKT